MVDASLGPDRIEERKDLGSGDEALYAYWMGQEKIAEKEERDWIKRAREIVKRYRDERPESLQSTHRFNILWSNVQTLIPTLYARTPKPDVKRRFMDPEQDTARFASWILERVITQALDNEESDFDAVLSAVVEDRLLPGRGTARVLYVPHYGDEIEDTDESGAEDVDTKGNDGEAHASVDGGKPNNGAGGGAAEEPIREVVFEEVIASYVFWEDYREGPARTWKEVPWVRYRAYMTRKELVKRFGKEKGEKVNLDFTPKGGTELTKDDPPPDLFKKAIVDEYWDRTTKQVIWIPPGTPDLILDEQDDPLRLPGFFPGPDPCLATKTNDKRVPVPDYVQYQDQARELDNLTARIDVLTRAVKVSGVYAGEEKQVLQQVFDEGTENRLIPFGGDWLAFKEKGTLEGLISWVPIKQIVEALIQLYNARDRVKQMMFEITGIGDIMRGQTSPQETFGAQRLKSNFVTRRVVPQQKAVAKFARNLIRLMAAVVGEHFSPKTISLMTGFPQLVPVPPPPMVPQPPQTIPAPIQSQPPQTAPGGTVVPMNPSQPVAQPQMIPNPAFGQWQQAMQAFQAATVENQRRQKQFDDAVAMIKEDTLHGFKIDIETDSTIAPDEESEKEARTEFLGKFIPLMQQVVPIAQGNPAMSALGRELVLFGTRAFPAARPLEEAIEKAFDELSKMPPNPDAMGGKGSKNGADSPADLATRKYEVDKRSQTEIQVQAEKSATEQAGLALKAQVAAENATVARAKLALESEAQAQQNLLRGARTESIQSREGASLV